MGYEKEDKVNTVHLRYVWVAIKQDGPNGLVNHNSSILTF